MLWQVQVTVLRIAYLAKPFRLCVLLEAESWEVDSRAEHLCLCQNADPSDAVNLHLHVRVSVRVTQISKMGSPSGVLCVAFDNHSVFIKRIR